jgi:tRNA (guanine26-N2/guanine27-N2)-dimethyltransferase
MWSGPLHDKDFVKAVLQHADEYVDKYGTSTRMKGMLSVVCEVGVARKSSNLLTFPSLGIRCTILLHTGKNCWPLPLRMPAFRRHGVSACSISCTSSDCPCSSALLNSGYKISRSHAFPGSLKTNAPRSFIHEVMRAWVKRHPVKMQNIKEGQVAHRLLAKELK